MQKRKLFMKILTTKIYCTCWNNWVVKYLQHFFSLKLKPRYLKGRKTVQFINPIEWSLMIKIILRYSISFYYQFPHYVSWYCTGDHIVKTKCFVEFFDNNNWLANNHCHHQPKPRHHGIKEFILSTVLKLSFMLFLK